MYFSTGSQRAGNCGFAQANLPVFEARKLDAFSTAEKKMSKVGRAQRKFKSKRTQTVSL